MIACVNNLKQVMRGQIVWANDHPSTNPPASDTGFGRLLSSVDISSYYKTLSNELLSPKILTCPSDSRKPVDDFRSLTTNHLSYFLNLDAMSGIDASTAFNGDRHITFAPVPHGPIVILTTNLSMQWTKKLGHRDRGNVALVDGSVQRTSSRYLATTLLPPSNTVPQRLLFP
jgi:prepilin-type processing-associated H-X9-DG protein